MTRRRGWVAGVGLAVWLFGAGVLVGTIAERMRFDHRRSAVLARYETMLRERNAQLMRVERLTALGEDVRP